jgi:hypothetical protein
VTVSASLRLADLLAGLSLVTDLGMGHPPEEAMRATLLATVLARKMDLPEPEVADVFYTALLQHVGCTAHAHESAQAFGNEIALNAAGSKTNFAHPPDIFGTLLPEVTTGMGLVGRLRIYAFGVTRGNQFGQENNTAVCEVARDIARRVGMSEMVQRSLHEMLEWWNGKGNPRGLKGEEIAFPARITRVATFAALFSTIGDEELALDAVRQRSGGFLDPSVVDLFTASGHNVLRDSAAADPRDALLAAEPEPHVMVPESRLADVARAFADIADLKTPFTTATPVRSQGSPRRRARSCGLIARPSTGCTSPRCCTTSGGWGYRIRSGSARVPSPSLNGSRSACIPITRNGYLLAPRAFGPWLSSRACITSASTAPVITAPVRDRRSTSRRASWPPPMRTKR